jgi:hypothetical protein
MLIAAEKIVAKGRRIAAHLMEAPEHDIEFERGRFVVAGTDKAIDLTQVARAAFVPARLPPRTEPGLFETGTFSGGERTYPNGCHISEVEADAETGAVALVRYTAVDDVGHIINPLLFEVQLHCGIAQGVGQALMENIACDASGPAGVRLCSMDYAMPPGGSFLHVCAGRDQCPRTNPRRQGAGDPAPWAGCRREMPSTMRWPRSGPYVQMPATAEKAMAGDAGGQPIAARIMRTAADRSGRRRFAEVKLYDPRSKNHGSFRSAAARPRILVVPCAGSGDVLFATSLIASLQYRFPQAVIDVLVF